MVRPAILYCIKTVPLTNTLERKPNTAKKYIAIHEGNDKMDKLETKKFKNAS